MELPEQRVHRVGEVKYDFNRMETSDIESIVRNRMATIERMTSELDAPLSVLATRTDTTLFAEAVGEEPVGA